MNPAELLAAVKMAHSGDNERPVRPLMEAQRMELLARWEAYNTHSPLQPGDFVAEKDGLGRLRLAARSDCLLMLWRLLDHSDWLDRQLIKYWIENGSNYDKIDCIVVMLTDDAVALAFLPHELAQLRKVES